MGDEEARIIAPAIAALRAEGIDATGPHPADALFAPRRRESYDVALCMYHDQALIPLKALDFDEGVNVTLGLPIVRTSPDHGTAFDIAGTGNRQARRDDRRDPHGRRMRRAARLGVDTGVNLPPLRDVIARHGLTATKALGQNFLLDEQLLDRIAAIPGDLAGQAGARDRPRPRRPHPRAAARRRRGHRDRNGPALPAGARRTGRGLSRPVARDRRRCDQSGARHRGAVPRRCQPALQCRHGPVHRLAFGPGGQERPGRRSGSR